MLLFETLLSSNKAFEDHPTSFGWTFGDSQALEARTEDTKACRSSYNEEVRTLRFWFQCGDSVEKRISMERLQRRQV